MQHVPALIIDLALILGSAAVVSIVFKWLKQPVVLGYILVGLLVGPNFHLFPTVVEIEGIKVWAEIGVIFLLFGLGLEFSFKKLIRLGGVAGITAVIEVFLTMLTGYFLGRFLGWEEMDCLFLGGILAIASTTIIIRSFDELGVKSQKFAGLVTGILIMEDLVAVILMVILSTVSVSRAFEGTEMMVSVLKLIFFLVLWFVSGIYFLPTILKASKKFLSEETLLVVSVALCLSMVLLAQQAGFSPALGAFIMGSILAETNKAEKIEHLIKPVKNIFGAVFFVSVGMLINLGILVDYYLPVLFGVFILLFFKPFYVMIGSLITGQSLKTSVQAGMTLSQIGEFSFIIASLGLSLNVISDHLYPVAVAISVITTFTTPFMIKLSGPFHAFLERKIPEKRKLALVKYSAGIQKVSEVSEWRKYVRRSIINIVVFSVIIISIIFLSKKFLTNVFIDNEWSQGITTVITLVLLSPFLWALCFLGVKRIRNQNTKLSIFQRGPLYIILLLRIGLALFFIGLLFDTFYSPLVGVIGVLATSILLFLFRSKIQSYYLKIQKRFKTNLNERNVEKEKSVENENDLKLLAPWDSHIATFELHPALKFVGKKLVDAKLREEFGVNIAVIKRGDLIINVPSRFELLYPTDVVSFIGTDVQLNTLKEYIATTIQDFSAPVENHEVSLQHFTINEDSAILGKTIRDSKMRELTKGLVVGIEREGQRYLNPDSDFVLQLNDTVWLVGDEIRIQVFLRR